MLVKATDKGASIVWQSKSKGERPNLTRDLSSIIPTPMVVGEHVYGIGSYGELRCLKVETGERIWATMQAVRGPLTPEKVAANVNEPSQTQPWMERWANAFLIRVTAKTDTILALQRARRPHHRQATPGRLRGSEPGTSDRTDEPHGRPTRRLELSLHYAQKCVFVRNDKELICLDVAK